jgi:heme exporter protein D
MGFWAWFWIWVALSVAALATLLLIGKSLFNRLLEVLHQLERLEPKTAALIAAIDNHEAAAKPADNVSDDPRLARAAWRKLVVAKAKKRQARQRRLIASLKAFKPEESRFH